MKASPLNYKRNDMRIDAVKLGRIEYAKALSLQQNLLALRQQEKIGDTLLLVEHDPVLTIGSSGSASNILLPRELLKEKGIDVYEVNRGGDVTYHGPGQIVGYPVLNLKNYGSDLRAFMWRMEDVFIHLLREQYSIEAYRDEKKYTGVWVGNDKITAVGVAVRKWVSMHGFAFNVNTNLEHFRWINPCGITDRGVTSLKKILGREMDFEMLNNQVAEYFCRTFGAECCFEEKSHFLDRIKNISVEE